MPRTRAVICTVLLSLVATSVLAQEATQDEKKGILSRLKRGGGEQESQDGEERKGILSRMRRGKGPQLAEGNIVILTTEAVGRPYELVTAFPAVAMEEWGGVSGVPPGGGLTDPGLTSVSRALEGLQALAKKYGADAVIGVKIDLEGPVDGEEGRAIAYGTMIRFVDDEAGPDQVEASPGG